MVWSTNTKRNTFHAVFLSLKSYDTSTNVQLSATCFHRLHFLQYARCSSQLIISFFSGHGSSLLVVYYLSSYAELAFFTNPWRNQQPHQYQHQHRRQCQRQRNECFVVISHDKVCQMWRMVQKAAVQNWWPIQDWSGQVMTNKKTENSSCNKAARWLISLKMEKTEGSSTQFVCIKVCSTTGCPR